MGPFNYYNPVRIKFGVDSFDSLHSHMKGRKPLVITDPFFKDATEYNRISSVKPNPTFKQLKEIYIEAWSYDFDVIVALGGGSVMDTAKVVSVYHEQGFEYVEDIIRKMVIPSGYKLIPIIAIPTTAGTGSEVTPWATVWDDDEQKKYSLHLEDLWCEACICDPRLTVSLPRDVTIHTALDALSHSLESIWNKNANAISTQYAITAAREILINLPLLLDDLDNVALRGRVMYAALNAGLAFSNTQTAIAHALSYHITAKYGVPHGIACSFTLPDIMDTVAGTSEVIDEAFNKICGECSSEKLRHFFAQVGISNNISDYVNELGPLFDSLKENQRAQNSVVDINGLFTRFSSTISQQRVSRSEM